MKINRQWAMPNRWTFTIKPIRELLEKEVGSGFMIKGLWCDPFAGKNSPAQVRNDINPERPAEFHLEALDFLKSQETDKYDGVLFDPPYSPEQAKRCYEALKLKITADKTRKEYWSKCLTEISRIIKPGGKLICFGWNSNGGGKCRGFILEEVLLVAHGGGRRDTICTVEIKEGVNKDNQLTK